MRTCLFQEDFVHPEIGMYFHIYTMDFPELHNHNYWEFFLILSGEIKQTTETSTQMLSTGMGCLIHPKDKHRFVGSTHNYEHLNLMITEEQLEKLFSLVNVEKFNQLKNATGPILYEIPDSTISEIKKLLDLLQTLSPNDNEKYESLLKLLWLEIIKFIYCTDLHSSNHFPSWLNAFMEKLHQPQNISKSIEELAKLTDYSYPHLCRLFKKYTGDTIHNHVAQLRINFAASLLRNTDMNILEISSCVGYDSLSHFMRVFKRYFKITPAKYRKST